MEGGITDEYLDADHRFVEIAENVCLDTSMDIVQRPGSHFLHGVAADTGEKQSSAVCHMLPFHWANNASGTYAKEYLATCLFGTKSIALYQSDGSTTTVPTTFTLSHVSGSFYNMSGQTWQQTPFITNQDGTMYPHKITESNTGAYELITAGLPQASIVNTPGNGISTHNACVLYAGKWGTAGEYYGYRFHDNADLTGYVFTDPPAASSLVHTYGMKFTFYRKYTVNGRTFVDEGPTKHIYLHTQNPIGSATGEVCFAIKIPTTNLSTSGTNWSSYISSNGVMWNNTTALGDIFVKVYRTTDGGTVYYNVGQARVTTATPTYASGVVNYIEDPDIAQPYYSSPGTYVAMFTGNDTFITGNATVYTTGGVLQNDAPPKAKFMHLVGGHTMVYGHVRDSSDQVLSYRALQAVTSDPDSVPSGNIFDLDAPITGISSCSGKLIIATLNKVYSAPALYDEFGRGGGALDLISAETGCVSHNSMVQVGDKIFFCGVDGFYTTNGVSVEKISVHLAKTYLRLLRPAVNEEVSNTLSSTLKASYGTRLVAEEDQSITGVYDRINNRILWSFLDGREIYCLELKAALSSKSSFWGPWRLGVTYSNNDSKFAMYLADWNGRLLRSDYNGYILQMHDGVASDPRPYSSSPYTDNRAMDRYPIIYRVRSIATSLGSSFIRKYVTTLVVTMKRSLDNFMEGTYYGFDPALDVQVTSINDKGALVQDLKPIHYDDVNDTNSTSAKSKEYSVGSYDGLVSSYDGSEAGTTGVGVRKLDNPVVVAKRKFPAGGLRCTYKQVEFKPALKLVSDSITVGENCTHSTGAASFVTNVWQLNTFSAGALTATSGIMDQADFRLNGYYLTLAYDSHKAMYPITAVSGDGKTVTLGTPYTNGGTVHTSPATSYAWKLWAYPKNQYFGLCGYNIGFMDSTASHSVSRAQAGEP